MKAKITIITAALAAALVSAPVLAQRMGGHDECGPRHGMMGGPGMMMFGDAGIEHLAHRLDLSKDQRTALRAIEDKYRPQLRDLRDRLQENHKALRNADGDEAKVRPLAEAQGKAISDMIVLHARIHGEIEKVLTDKQREQLHRQHERMMEHHG